MDINPVNGVFSNPDLLEEIFNYLDFQSIKNVCLVSK